MSKKSLKSVGKKIAKHVTEVEAPAYEDPVAQLRRLVQEHASTNKACVATELRSSDRTFKDKDEAGKETKVTLKCRLPQTVIDAEKAHVAALKKHMDHLVKCMRSTLKSIPLWTEFLSKVRGCGPVTGAYLLAFVDFSRCEKPSDLRRYCGLGVTDGRADRRTKGQKLSYNASLKTALFLMFDSLRRTTTKCPEKSKYLRRWNEAKHGLLLTRGPLGTKEQSQGFCDSKARRKAQDLFVEDLYIVGRSLAGLPVWPSWYAKAMGYEHGGKVAVLAPKMLTLEEALSVVGVSGEDAQDEDIEALDAAYSELVDVAAE